MSRAIKDYNGIDWGGLFYYDPSVPTGLRWKEDRFAGKGYLKAKRGDPAGTIHTDKSKNYQSCTVSHRGTRWFAARVVWILHNGYLDNELVIDHIDGNTLNNNIENLRAVKQVINNRNASKRKDNSTGVSGVHFTTASNHKGGVYTYATASWYTSENVRKSCHYSVLKHGLLPAFRMAFERRELEITKLNELGYGYTDKHGTD